MAGRRLVRRDLSSFGLHSARRPKPSRPLPGMSTAELVVCCVVYLIGLGVLIALIRRWPASAPQYQPVVTLIAAGIALFAAVITIDAQNRRIDEDKNDRRVGFAHALLRDIDQAIQPLYALRGDMSNPAQPPFPDDPSDRAKYLRQYEIETPARLTADPLLLGLLSKTAQEWIDRLATACRRYNAMIEKIRDAQSLRNFALTDTFGSAPTNLSTLTNALSKELRRITPEAELSNDEILARLQAGPSLVYPPQRRRYLQILKSRCKDVQYSGTPPNPPYPEKLDANPPHPVKLIDVPCDGDLDGLIVPP
jgi:hypothetical protein